MTKHHKVSWLTGRHDKASVRDVSQLAKNAAHSYMGGLLLQMRPLRLLMLMLL